MTSQAGDNQPACPVDHKAREAWLQAARAQAADANSKQQAQSLQQPSSPLSGSCDSTTIDQSPSQQPSIPRPKFASSRLSTQRETSTIPRAITTSTTSPNAQNDAPATSASGHWIYPSESQFHAALVRKHGSGAAPPESTMSAVVPIHNAVNERTWTEILGWEALDRARGAMQAPPKKEDKDSPRLVSFSGDSQKLTPRARFLSLMGYTKPFDRHDWIVERASGERVEYVIDFYSGRGSAGGQGNSMPLSFYLDVRPKLNSYEGARMRFCKFWGWQ